MSDKGTYNQVITSDKIEEEKERKGSVGTDRERGGVKAVRGPLGSIRGRQRSRDSQVSDVQEGSMRGRSLTLGNISESDFNGNHESFRGFPYLIYHLML